MRLAAHVVAVGAALLLAGCGGSSRSFVEDDLPNLVLKSTESPAGTNYAAQASGAGALEKEQDGAQTVAALKPFGFQADYASMFFGEGHFAESIAILFDDAEGAGKALASLERLFGSDVSSIDTAGLGEESWGLAGVFFPKAPPGVFYGWRRGNVLLLLNVSPSTSADVRPVADSLDERAG